METAAHGKTLNISEGNEFMKIELGKFYKTRQGLRARVVCVDAPSRQSVVVVLEDGQVYTCSKIGCYYCPEHPNACDLIAPWHQIPYVDWLALPAWVNFVAKGNDGRWRAYIRKPEFSTIGWLPAGEFPCVIPGDYAPKWDGDWSESLTSR
jgi:hypothetical protein